jgi:hypothetical protein
MSSKPTDAPPRPRAVLTQDKELKAMNKVSAELGSLDADARQRVLAWVQSRYCPATAPAAKGGDSPTAAGDVV